MARQNLKLFISHSSEDDNFIGKLVKKMKTKMPFIEPILAVRQKMLTKAFENKIMQLIRESDAVMVLFTEIGIHNQWINQELGYAVALSKPIVAVVERQYDSKGKETPIETQGFITSRHESAPYKPKDEEASILKIMQYINTAYEQIKATTAEELEQQAILLESRELHWEAYQKFNEVTKIYLDKKDFTKAISSINKGIDNLQRGDEWLWEVAHSRMRLARILSESGAESNIVVREYESAAEAFSHGDIPYPYEAAEALEKAANVALESSNLGIAYDFFIRAADVFERSGNPSRPKMARKKANDIKKMTIKTASRKPKSK